VSGGYCKTAVSRWPSSQIYIKMKHTEGRWHIDGHNLTAVIAEQNAFTSYTTYQHVCTCDYGYADPLKYLELNKANARLIAKAPEMIELIKAFCQANPNDGTWNYQACMDKARQIVAELERGQ